MNNKFVDAVLEWRDSRPALTFHAKYVIWYEPTWCVGHRDDLKSNDYTGITKKVKEIFIENIESRITELKNQGKNPVIILPPQKLHQNQSMEFVKDKFQNVCCFLSIQSPAYEKLHKNQKSQLERQQVINGVVDEWELSVTKFEKNTHFIFVDDMFTCGATTMGVLKKLDSLDREIISKQKSFGWSSKLINFEGMYLTRRKQQNKYVHVQCEELSQEINNEARPRDITLEYLETL